MDPVTLLLSDLDAALERLKAAWYETDELRRALREALNVVYILREYRKEQEKLPVEDGDRAFKPYYERANSDAGRPTEGLVAVRGIGVHDPARFVGPQLEPTFPRPGLYPSEHLFPGANLWWRPLPAAIGSRGARKRYAAGAANRLVLEVFADARQFLSTGPA